MLFIIYISSGLFLGWSLGSNDAANIFGSAVGSKMLRFKQAALIASIFVILGAVFQGKGGAETLNALGAVDALAGGFTVSLCAALTVFFMTRKGLPVSTSQAIVGAIMGWIYFTGNKADLGVLSKIVTTWISGPILGMIFSALLFLALRFFLNQAKIHVIKLDTYIRISLIVTGAFGAYSLGANNIANVMGVFLSSAPAINIDFGFFSLDGVQILLLLGGISIAVGIYTYSERVMHTVGNGILSISPEAAIVVVLSQALVLFLFSSSGLSNLLISIGLPPLPLVPVSSTQVVIGAVLGIGLVKGSQDINTKTLIGIAMGWITTPILAGVLTFIALFFVQNVFDLPITIKPIKNDAVDLIFKNDINTIRQLDMIVPGIIITSVFLITMLVFLILRQQKLRLKAENDLLAQQNQLFQTQRSLSEMEMKAIQSKNEVLHSNLELRRKEFIDMAFNLTEQRLFLEELTNRLEGVMETEQQASTKQNLKSIIALIRQKMSFAREKETFYGEVEQIHKDFKMKLDTSFPGLSDQEKKLATLIRLNLSNKEIATLLSISPKSVEVSRYRLKRKLGLEKEDNLLQFINTI
ncbi:MAG: putative permease [Bacteroidetes bacterium]|nr:MAG: putative permease [Bacteroidota bacterium]